MELVGILSGIEPQLAEALRATCIVVPAYNEAAVIGEVLAGLEDLPCTVIAVDDGSSDRTHTECADFPVALLRHSTNLGQGAAIQTGIAYALTLSGAKYIVTFDADGQHKASDIVSLIGKLLDGPYDVALGSRFIRSADARSVPRGRRMLLRCAVWFTRRTSGLAVSDTHNGLRAFTVEAAACLDLQHGGMAHASEILGTIRRKRLRWCEVPVSITYTEYTRGKGQRGGAAVNIMWDLITGRIR
jgi:polyprenyl-phospho-N-acetylgalactosaminyl synthase